MRGKDSLFHRAKSRKTYACDHCDYPSSPAANTIFDHAPTPLTTWFDVIYLMAPTRGGISAMQIQRETGVTYKTPWRTCKEVHNILARISIPFVAKGKWTSPTLVASWKPESFPAPSAGPSCQLSRRMWNGERKYSPMNSTSLKRCQRWGYKHATVPHAEPIYVLRDAHTNTIEGFWSQCKNGICGVYYAVSAKYLQHYLNEYAFDITPMFLSFLWRFWLLLHGQNNLVEHL